MQIIIVAITLCIVIDTMSCIYVLQISGENSHDINVHLTRIHHDKSMSQDEWEISTDDIIVEELLGEGAFGEVYKGVIRGQLKNPKVSTVLRQAIGVPVAIKLLKRE